MKILYESHPSAKNLDPRLKFFLWLLVLPSVSFLSPGPGLVLLSFFLLVTILFFRFPIKEFLKHLMQWALVIALVLWLVVLIYGEGSLSERFGSAGLIASQFILAIGWVTLYILTMRTTEIPQVLMWLKLPHRFGILLIIGFRLIPLLRDRIDTLRLTLATRAVPGRWKRFQLLMIGIVLAAIESGFRIGQTMTVRGYDPKLPITRIPFLKPRPAEMLYALCSLGVIGAAVRLLD